MKKTKVFAALGSLVVVIIALHWAARFDLRGPDSLSRSELDRWTDDPALVVMTALRWAALAFSYYLLVVVAVVGLTSETDRHRGVRRLIPTRLVGMVGALLGSSAVLVPLAAHLAQPAAAPTSHETEQVLQLAPLEEPLRLAQLSDEISKEDDPGDILSSDVVSNVTSSEDTWNVALGDHLWSIAAESLEDHWGRTNLTDREIASYWKDLIVANEDRLVEPGNPDLIFPGQTLVLPPPPNDPVKR